MTRSHVEAVLENLWALRDAGESRGNVGATSLELMREEIVAQLLSRYLACLTDPRWTFKYLRCANVFVKLGVTAVWRRNPKNLLENSEIPRDTHIRLFSKNFFHYERKDFTINHQLFQQRNYSHTLLVLIPEISSVSPGCLCVGSLGL